MSPTFFRSSRALALLGAVAVGSSLALASVALAGMRLGFGFLMVCGALPTALAGLVWALALRRSVFVGWALAAPLAGVSALVTGLVAALFAGTGDLQRTLGLGPLHALGTFAGMVLLGLPLAWSRRQASLGLAGAERGEVLVGVECVWVSSWALVVRGVIERMRFKDDAVFLFPLEITGQHAMLALGLLGAVSGLATTALALWRGRQRRALIASAAAGERPDYRVEHTPAGSVLVRMRVVADDYRQSDTDEESFALDEDAFAAAHPGRRAPGA